MVIFKFKFAGSGDSVWRKCIGNRVPKKAKMENGKFKIRYRGEEEYQELNLEQVQKAYGAPMYSKDKKIICWIKEKIKNNEKIVEHMFPGPGTIDVFADIIERNCKLAIEIITAKINNILKNTEEKIFIKIKGHSRGGVTANIFANKLEKIYKKNEYKQKFNDRVSVVSVTFDPVPGGDHNFANTFTKKHKKYFNIVQNKKIQGAVVYALNSEHSVGFDPQTVNSKIVVLCDFTRSSGSGANGHSTGLNEASKQDPESSYRKSGYVYKNKIISPGNLYQLEKGIYYAHFDKNQKDQSEHFNLYKIEKSNYEKYLKIISEVCKDKKRLNIFKNLIPEKNLSEEGIKNFIIKDDFKSSCENLSELFNDSETFMDIYKSGILNFKKKFKKYKKSIPSYLKNKIYALELLSKIEK